MKTKNLIKTIANICHYATEHTTDWDLDCDDVDFENLFQCTSYTVACYLSQNTKSGHEGVESDIFLDLLCERPIKSLDEWMVISTFVVNGFNDLKPGEYTYDIFERLKEHLRKEKIKHN